MRQSKGTLRGSMENPLQQVDEKPDEARVSVGQVEVARNTEEAAPIDEDGEEYEEEYYDEEEEEGYEEDFDKSRSSHASKKSGQSQQRLRNKMNSMGGGNAKQAANAKK